MTADLIFKKEGRLGEQSAEKRVHVNKIYN